MFCGVAGRVGWGCETTPVHAHLCPTAAEYRIHCHIHCEEHRGCDEICRCSGVDARRIYYNPYAISIYGWPKTAYEVVSTTNITKPSWNGRGLAVDLICFLTATGIPRAANTRPAKELTTRTVGQWEHSGLTELLRNILGSSQTKAVL